MIELKSNEKLTANGKQNVEDYYRAVIDLLPVCSANMKIKVVHTLRCIVHGGMDPASLKHENSDFSHEEHRARIQDNDYIIARIFNCGALESIVDQFTQAANALDYFQDRSSDAKQLNTSHANNAPDCDDELAFYGLPSRVKQSNNQMEDILPSLTISTIAPEEASPLASSSPIRALVEEKITVLIELTQEMLGFCLDLSQNSECASSMSEFGMCCGVLLLLHKDFNHDPRDRRIPHQLELLWTILECFLERMKTDKADNNFRKYDLMKDEVVLDMSVAVPILKHLLIHLLSDGFRQFDKECRNEVIIIFAMVAEFPNSIGHFLSNGMVDFLLTYACVEEMHAKSWAYFIPNIANSRNFGSLSDIDLEFKKQVWMLLNTLLRSNDPDVLLCFAASPLMSCMLAYMEQDGPDTLQSQSTTKRQDGSDIETRTLQSPSGSYHLNPWDESKSFTAIEEKKEASRFKTKNSNWQVSTKATISLELTLASKKGLIASLTSIKLKEFQVLACVFLVHHAPKVLGEFERLDGPSRVLSLAIKHCRAESAEQKSLVLHSLLLLYRCLLHSITVRAYLEESQAIQSLLFLFSSCVEDEARAQAVRIIAALCARGNTPCQGQLFECQGLEILLLPIRQYITKRPAVIGLKAGIKIYAHLDCSEPLPDPLESPFGGEISVLIVALLDCLKEAVPGNIRNEHHFAALEGLDSLLGLLEIAPFVLRLQVMRLLADLLLNPQLVVYCNVWRSSKTLRSAAQVLAHAFMDEEARLGSERKERGVICDLFHPLQNQQWPLTESEKNITLLTRAQPGSKDIFTQSVTVNKLATAILAGRNALQTNLPVELCMKALECDQRIVISSLLHSMGLFAKYDIQDNVNPFKLVFLDKAKERLVASVDGTLSDAMLTPRERQVLVLAKKFQALREGEWWQEVCTFVTKHSILPIEADLALINARLEAAFDAALAAQTEQMALVNVEYTLQKEGEDGYLDQILSKKQQQIKAEWLKTHSKTASRKPAQIK